MRAGHLLRLRGREMLRFGWEGWFVAMDGGSAQENSRKINAFRSFSHFPLLLQSACQDEGIAVGWRPLIDSALAAGHLVKAWPVQLKSSRGYVLAARRPLGTEARRFHDWVVAQAAEAPRSGAVPVAAVTSPA